MCRADSEMVAYLLSKGANPRISDRMGRTALHMLCTGQDDQNRMMPIRKPLLRWACHGELDNHVRETQRCVEMIIEGGALVDARRKLQPGTPLWDAVNSRDCAAVMALLTAGANANVTQWDGKLPVQHWVSEEKICMLYPDLYEPSLILLLKHTTDWETYHSQDGQTILHYALQCDDVRRYEKIVQLLQKHSRIELDINARDNYGATPLLESLRRKSYCQNAESSDIGILVAAQLRLGADISVYDKTGSDFIWYICNNGYVGDTSCREFIDLRFKDLAMQDRRRLVSKSQGGRNGTTALMEAVRNSYKSCVDYFLSLSIDLDTLNKEKNTVLDLALEKGERLRYSFLENWFGRKLQLLKKPLSDSSLFHRRYGTYESGTFQVCDS